MESRYYNLLLESAQTLHKKDDKDKDDGEAAPQLRQRKSPRKSSPRRVSDAAAFLSDDDEEVAVVTTTRVRRTDFVNEETGGSGSSINSKLICIFLLVAIAFGVYFALQTVGIWGRGGKENAPAVWAGVCVVYSTIVS